MGQNLAVQQGNQITFGGWAYLESGAASDLGWLLQAENSSQQGIAWYAAAPKAASAGWVFQYATYTVPAGVSYVALYAQIWQATAASVLRVDDGFLYDDRLSVTTVQNLDYLPFGEINSTDSGISTHKFTGDERDSETSLDHTWFRQYSSQFARWTSPDPAGLAAVDPSNPQSWNRYAYVLNNPLNLVDLLGLDDCGTHPLYDGCGMGGDGGGGFGPGVTCMEDDVIVDCGSIFGSGAGGRGGGSGAGTVSVYLSGGCVLTSGPNPGADGSNCFPGEWATLSLGSGSVGNSSWAWTFTKNFLANFVSPSFYKQELQQGGCLNTFVHATGNALIPTPLPSVSTTAGAGTLAVSAAMRYNAAQAYAASRTNVLGGQGLIFPQKSMPYNNILKGSAVTNLAEGGLGYVDGALFQGLLGEAEAAYNGNCH